MTRSARALRDDMTTCHCSFLPTDALPQDARVVTMSTARTSVQSHTSTKHRSFGKTVIDQRGSPANRISSHISHTKHPAVSALSEVTVWCSPLRNLLGAVASCTPKICARASCVSTCSWRNVRREWKEKKDKVFEDEIFLKKNSGLSEQEQKVQNRGRRSLESHNKAMQLKKDRINDQENGNVHSDKMNKQRLINISH